MRERKERSALFAGAAEVPVGPGRESRRVPCTLGVLRNIFFYLLVLLILNIIVFASHVP